MEQQFWKYVLPSMITVLLGGTFAFVDGIFTGQGCGDVGLTAVNLVAPMAALVTALAAGVGMGGSIMMSTYAGGDDEQGRKKARGCTMTMLLFLSVALFFVGGLLSPQIVRLLGAEGALFQPALNYLEIVLTFACFQLFSSGLSSLLINSGKSVLAMLVMVGALVLNIGLDWLFVLGLRMGTQGAALATVIGQGASAIVFTFVLFHDRNTRPMPADLKPQRRMLRDIIRTGFSPFGIQLAPSIVVLSINYACVLTNGRETLAVFAVMNQLILAIQILFTGIGNGIQPIISYCTGAGDTGAVQRTFQKALSFMACIAAVLIVGLYMARSGIPILFNASLSVAEEVQQVLRFVLLMIPLTGFIRVLISFFFASGKHLAASILTYAEPLFVMPVCLLICCGIFGANGVWLAMVLAQVVLSLLGGVFLIRVR